MRVADVLELVRAPAVLTVLGDTVVGATASGRPAGPVGVDRLTASGSSALLYAAGMALNDYADAELDAEERPERPIPSGRISRSTALAIATGLTAGGLALAAAGGRARLAVAVPLTAMVWTYDLQAKGTPAGPVVMGACRGLDVVMGGAGRGWRRTLPAAGLLALHTASVTRLSTGEVHGATRGAAAAALAVTGLTGAGVVRGATAPALAAAAATAYAGTCGPAQAAAVQDPAAPTVRTATRAGISAMVPLQAALAARSGRPAPVAALGLLTLATRALAARRRRSTDTTGDLT